MADAQGTAQAQQEGPHGTEGTDPQPQTVSREEYDKLLAQSRKWEDRAKANAAAAKELDAIRAQSMTDAERLEAASKRAEQAEAELAAYRAKAERAGIVAEVAAKAGVDADWLGRMAGDTREEIAENAKWLKSRLAASPVYPSVADAGQAAPVASSDPRESFSSFMKNFD